MDFAYDENGNLVLLSIDIMSDGRLGLYDFGARYYDPFLGLWMSPDPAGQFANSYTYGGDPINYIDPTGMWALGVGFIVSWDEQHGWGFGVGLAGGRSELSYVYNYQDASHSFTASIGGSYQISALNLNASLGYNFNSYTGHSLSVNGGACLGDGETMCAGVEVGGALYWSASGNFMGSTAYLGAYATFAGGLARISSGYEAGFMGMEGRGHYAGATFAGVHADASDRDGFGWGLRESLYFGIGNNSSSLAADGTTASMVKWELWLPTLGRFGHVTFGDQYDVSSAGLDDIEFSKFKEIVKDKVLLDDIIKAGCVKNFGKDLADRIDSYLLENGYERNDHVGKHEKGSEKRTYRPIKSSIYGNLEIVVRGDGSTYSSYNYGNNRISHILIDYFGWKGRGY